MQIKIRKVDANREDTDAPDYTQGDATLEGAIYQIYRYDPQTDGYTEKVILVCRVKRLTSRKLYGKRENKSYRDSRRSNI